MSEIEILSDTVDNYRSLFSDCDVDIAADEATQQFVVGRLVYCEVPPQVIRLLVLESVSTLADEAVANCENLSWTQVEE